MDVSKLCTENEEVGEPTSLNSKESSLPNMHSSESNDTPLPYIISDSLSPPNQSENVNTIIYQSNPQLDYQQRYMSQHRNLKNYTSEYQRVDERGPGLSPASSTFYYGQSSQQQQDLSRLQHNRLPSTRHLPLTENDVLSNMPPFHSSNTTSTTSSLEDINNNDSEDNSKIIDNNSSNQTRAEKNNLLGQMLGQCSMIHSRIGKYRIDPLTAVERSEIIDQVYHTAEIMLRTLKQLQDDNYTISPSPSQQPQQPLESVEEVYMDEGASGSASKTINNMNDSNLTQEYKMIRQARNLEDENTRPKYRRRSKRSMVGQTCHSCKTSSTPEWRRGPDGARTLCNACGLHYSKLLRKGSMTVQTHNYMLESPLDFKRAPRLIQFPIIQVNNPLSLPVSQHPSSSSLNMASVSSRIREIHQYDEPMDEAFTKDVG